MPHITIECSANVDATALAEIPRIEGAAAIGLELG